ncbi:MAG: repressor LexA [Halobacteriovoraceae bacterium]|nr:repressor LexA [Halobacteriovoraceae bacterium]
MGSVVVESLSHLTKKQEEVLLFIRNYYEEEGRTPSYSEIQHYFGLKSKSSVQDYIGYLKKAGFLQKSVGSRAIELVKPEETTPMTSIPLLGSVAAGRPLDVQRDDSESEFIGVPQSMVGGGRCYALSVKGKSMIDDGIMEGDLIVVKHQSTARNGETVVALIDGAATVKRYYRKKGVVELHPANEKMGPFFVRGGPFEIQGIVVGLLRHY